MSDLCYNCGDCHLPRPCAAQLKQCNICQNWGHSYNFCPKSVRLQDPHYQFWALCHNCDMWHLPDPGKFAMYQCTRCGHLGHKEFFCPINAVHRNPHASHTNNADTQKGNKRLRTSDSSPGSQVVNGGFVHPETVRKIMLDAVHEAFQYQIAGYTNEQIIGHFTKPAPPPQVEVGQSTNTVARHPSNADTPSNNVFSAPTGHGMAQPVTSSAETPAPRAPATILPSHGGTIDNVYSEMHRRFDQDQLIQATSHEAQVQNVAAIAFQPTNEVASTTTIMNSPATTQENTNSSFAAPHSEDSFNKASISNILAAEVGGNGETFTNDQGLLNFSTTTAATDASPAWAISNDGNQAEPLHQMEPLQHPETVPETNAQQLQMEAAGNGDIGVRMTDTATDEQPKAAPKKTGGAKKKAATRSNPKRST
ncbi:hypothetical protein LTR37_003387 [Vermiconidia calcicola]|uniref:Uncharacterized protein n=1 Tax=Vermiconidia calcicola TaxID=1690605 RepID=A0ACC3NQ50_9PEZI|nr:hypothetical protein LTR37_003387 [Vermiconidia calcicola]